jgi:hypothetical protein
VLSVLKIVQCTQVQCGQKVGLLNAELVESAVTTRLCIVFYLQPFSCSGLVNIFTKVC